MLWKMIEWVKAGVDEGLREGEQKIVELNLGESLEIEKGNMKYLGEKKSRWINYFKKY